MTQRIVVIGSGFAGMWAALSAARTRALAGRDASSVEIVVVSPQPVLVIRPRLYEYETPFEAMAPDLQSLFDQVSVRHIAGQVERIDTAARSLAITTKAGSPSTLAYDRLILAPGSTVFRPELPGLAEHAFDVDQLDSAIALDRHLKSLANQPDSAARNTIVVAGGGFTGIETVAEMPARLRSILGAETKVRVIVVERADAIGPDLGPGPRPLIEQALRELGVEIRTGAAVTAIDSRGVTLEGGERIDASTVVWTAGSRASALAAQVPGERDRFGRLHVSRDLRVESAAEVFATGDVAYAASDELGNHASMSCQHAIALGRAAGHNAAADLLGLPLRPYSQPKYVTCLDLGVWGAIFTEGWDRVVKLQGAEGKAVKRTINTEWIYPPQGSLEAILATADPAIPVVA